MDNKDLAKGCLGIFVGGLIVAGCVAAFGGSKDPAAKSKDDSSLACDHFRNIAGDIADGVLTDSEMRSKFKEVNENAIIGTPAVQAAAKDLVRSATIGDAGDVLVAMSGMDKACRDAGH